MAGAISNTLYFFVCVFFIHRSFNVHDIQNLFANVNDEIDVTLLEIMNDFISQCEMNLPAKLLDIYTWKSNVSSLTYNPSNNCNNVTLLQTLSFLQNKLDFMANDVTYRGLSESMQWLHHQLTFGTLWMIIVANDIEIKPKCLVNWLNKYNDLKLN